MWREGGFEDLEAPRRFLVIPGYFSFSQAISYTALGLDWRVQPGLAVKGPRWLDWRVHRGGTHGGTHGIIGQVRGCTMDAYRRLVLRFAAYASLSVKGHPISVQE